MQLLYAYQQGALTNKSELYKALHNCLTATFHSYVYNLYLLCQTALYAPQEAVNRQSKFLSSEEDHNISTRIAENPLILALVDDTSFTRQVKEAKLTNYSHRKILKSCFQQLLQSSDYQEYASRTNPKVSEHKSIVAHLYQDILLVDDDVENQFEEIFPHWRDDVDVVAKFILKSISKFNPDSPKLYFPSHDAFDEALTFGRRLIEQTITNNREYEELIEGKLVNWELDRIATIDIILMKMALSELIHFPYIPVKVTINEYIDISKDYSTPKSKDFINGLLDKLTQHLRKDDRIQKRGRGLVE